MGEEFSRCEDLDTSEWIEIKQIFVTSHDERSMSREGAGKKHVVIWITADANQARGSDLDRPDVREEFLFHQTSDFILTEMKLGVVQDADVLVQQGLGDQ